MRSVQNLTIWQAFTAPRSLIAIGLTVLSQLVNPLVSEAIQKLYPDRPIVPDFLFTILPDIAWMQYLTDPIMMVLIVLIFTYILSHHRDKIPYYFCMNAFVYFGRAALMILTPLGRPTGNLSSYGIFEVINLRQHGMFPSGHAGLAAIIFLMIDRKTAPVYKWIAGIMCVLEVVTLILSRGHYSIDIVGGIMLSYIIYILMEKKKDWYGFNLNRQRSSLT